MLDSLFFIPGNLLSLLDFNCRLLFMWHKQVILLPMLISLANYIIIEEKYDNIKLVCYLSRSYTTFNGKQLNNKNYNYY